jgi:hypothetical protein
MRKLMTIGALLAGLSAIGAAETWSGTLLDANCARHSTTKACDAKRSSGMYLLDVNGTRYRLDSASNEAVRTVLDARADKASNPFATKAKPVTATLTGRLRGSDKIHATVVEVQ